MSGENWTPGPWRVQNGCVYGGDTLVASFGFNVRVGSDEDDANQRLTSQAPAMAALLERVVEAAAVPAREDARVGVIVAEELVPEIRALLARARGEVQR